jgi:glutamate-1-semialdehyde 2,1-aminomutase
LCDQFGVVYIMDEVKTGFRVAPGGAQEFYGITADLVTFAKSMGNGYPVAAFGGKSGVMDVVGKGVAHGGTYTGNSVGMAAAEKTLEIISNTNALERVADHGKQLIRGITDVLEAHDIPFVITGHPSMFGLVFSKDKPKDLRGWLRSDHAFYERLAEALFDRGVMPDLDAREPWFISAAHTETEVDEVLTAFEDAIEELVS